MANNRIYVPVASTVHISVSASETGKDTFQRNRLRVAAPSPRASLGRRTVCGRTEQRRPTDLKRHETKVRMVWGSFLIAAAALKTPKTNGYYAQGVKRTFPVWPLHNIAITNIVWCIAYKGRVGEGRTLHRSRAMLLQ